MNEPIIDINGRALTEAQAMAVRVAITAFYGSMNKPDALGDDEHGRAMTALYRERLAEVLKMMIAS